jgi:hypothetical protein
MDSLYDASRKPLPHLAQTTAPSPARAIVYTINEYRIFQNFAISMALPMTLKDAMMAAALLQRT